MNYSFSISSIFLDFLLDRISVTFFFSRFACRSLFRVFIFGVGFKQNQRLLLIGTDIFDQFGSWKFCLINEPCVILLPVIIADRVLVVVEDLATYRGSGIVVASKGVELKVETFLEKLENVLLFVLNSNFSDRFLDGDGQGCFFHLVELKLGSLLGHDGLRLSTETILLVSRANKWLLLVEWRSVDWLNDQP